MSSNSLPRIRRSFRLAATALAMAVLFGCSTGGLSVVKEVEISTSSPVTLVAGSTVDLIISVTCDPQTRVAIEWVDRDDQLLAAPGIYAGVVLPPFESPSNLDGKIDCLGPDPQGGGSGRRKIRLFAADNATLGLHSLALRATTRRDVASVDVDVNVTAPVAPGFSLSAPAQVNLSQGGSSNVPVSVTRNGYDGSVTLTWQSLLMPNGFPFPNLATVDTVDPIPGGSASGPVPVFPPSTGPPFVLLRALGGGTERAALVRILSNANPPPVPTSFRATPDVTSIVLAWDAAAGLLTYMLERQTVSGGAWEPVSAAIPGSATGYTDNGRAPDTPYSYRLSATNVNGTSPFATLSTRTLPTPPPPGNTGWQQLGPAVSSNSDVEPQPSMLVDGSGRVVVAYRYRSPTGLSGVIVKRYNFGGFWTQLGAGTLNSNLSDGFSPSMAIDAAGVLYVAWTEYTGVSQRLYVSRFTSGGAWESVVPGDQPVDVLGAAASRPSIVVLPSGAPVLAWVQGGSIQVRTLTSGAWTLPAGGSGFTATTAYDVRLRLDGSTPVVAWAEGVGAGNALHVARGTAVQDGFTFSAVGGAANATPPSGSPSINFFDIAPTGGTDYLVYAQGSTGFTIRARYFSGGSWFDYSAPIVDNNADELIGVGVAADPLTVAWSSRPVSQAFGSVFSVSHVTQSGWAPLTPNFGDSWIAAPNGISMRMASAQSPLVANGVQVGDSYELRVRQYFQP